MAQQQKAGQGRSMVLPLVAGGLLLAGAAWWWMKPAHVVEPAAGPQGGGVPVETMAARTGELAETLQVAGQVQANSGVELRSEVTGRVVAVKFKDGTKVRQGDVLVVLDDSVQRATLAQAEANHALAQANVGRYQRLAELGAASRQQVDQAVAEDKLQVANIAMAKANLAKFRIAAPFAGTAGIAQVNVGDLVQPGELLVALTDNDTLKVTFKVPEVQATSLKVGAPVTVQADAAPGTVSSTVVEGTIAALDGRVDPASRTLEGKVILDNRDGVMVAGQFVRVRVPVRSVEDAVMVPDQALVPQGVNTFVFVVVPGKDGGLTASRTTVQVGLRSGGMAQVVTGVQSGQKVVTAGQQKLQAPVMPVTLVTPTVVDVAPQAVEELR